MDLIKASFFCVIIACVVYYLQYPREYPVTKTTNATYDYIIVGAGTAGALLASRLTEDPRVRVLLLEAGSDGAEVAKSYETPLFAPFLQHSESDWQDESEPLQKYAILTSKFAKNRHYFPSGKVLGGSGMYNYMQYVRGSRYDFDEWDENGCSGWSYKDVLPYFLKSEDILVKDYETSIYHNKGGQLGVSLDSVFADVSRSFLEAGKELGFQEIDYNGEEQIGFGYSQINTRNGVRESTLSAFLGPAMGRDNLHVVVNAYVTKVNIQNKRATGVNFIQNGVKKMVTVEMEVILSAGAFRSPQLLLLSGVGPKDHLEQLNIPLVTDLPVGQNFQNHPMFIFPSDINSTSENSVIRKIHEVSAFLQYTFLKSGLLSSTGVAGTAFVKTETKKAGYPDIQLHVATFQPSLEDNSLNKTFLDGVYHRASEPGISIILFLLHPRSRGKVTLKSSDPFDYPCIDLNVLDNTEDISVMVEAIELAEKLLETKALRQIGTDSTRFRNAKFCASHEYRSRAFYECLVKHLTETVSHYTSTCRMGPESDMNSVVDPTLKVKGVQGLRVVDASVIPNAISGNTNAAVVMIAEKAADMIRGIDSVEHIRVRLSKELPKNAKRKV